MIKWIDLHSHLEWSIPLKTINEIRKGNRKEKIIKQQLNWLPEFSKFFWEVSRSLQKEKDFERATREFLIDQFNNWVVYSEFRIAPYHHVFWGWKSFEKIIESIKKGINQAKNECSIIWKVIIESARQYWEEHVNTVFERTLKSYEQEYIVWFWIWWIENDWDLYQYNNILEKCEINKIPVSLHAGENNSQENLLFSSQCPAIKRIWHWLSFKNMPNELQKTVKWYNKLIEVCLSSNICLWYIKNLEDHPIKKMYDLKIPLSICTDDAMIFGTSFQEELVKASQLIWISQDDMKKINLEAMKFAFCNEQTKDLIIRILTQ